MVASLTNALLLIACLINLAAGEAASLTPAFRRVDLAADATAEVALTLAAASGVQVTAITVDCACLRALTPLPATVGPSGALEIRLRASGIRPGVEPIVVATTTGTARAELQIVGPGAGTGMDVLTKTVARAAGSKLSLWGIVHDFRGTIRNCGCSKGALGGIGHLAALPGHTAALAAHVDTRWILTGDINGARAGVSTALTERGWRLNDPAVVIAADPAPFLALPDLTVVILTGPSTINHQRILRPVLTGGLIVDLLLVDAAGNVQEHHVMPVDSTLADASEITARFPDPLTSRIDMAANPSATCTSCHASAHTAWAGSRHALALESLKSADRTDSCIGCHTTLTADKVLAPGVGCQACHTGTAAHVATAGTIRTTKAGDCRTCHDAKHHPAFDREEAWKVILHGRAP